jgi:hypothetical protein
VKNSPRTPKYRRQARAGGADLAFVELSGQRFYLGEYGSEESKEKYRQKIAEWEAAGRRAPVAAAEITVAELIERYWEFAQELYRSADGKPLGEINPPPEDNDPCP